MYKSVEKDEYFKHNAETIRLKVVGERILYKANTENCILSFPWTRETFRIRN